MMKQRAGSTISTKLALCHDQPGVFYLYWSRPVYLPKSRRAGTDWYMGEFHRRWKTIDADAPMSDAHLCKGRDPSFLWPRPAK